MITITLKRDSIISDLRVKSHEEAMTIQDPEARYAVEAGTEKLAEVNQCVTDAFSEVSSLLREVLSGTVVSTANDAYTATGDLVLSLDVSSRKSPGLAKPLTDALHALAVNSALGRFYRSVGRIDLGDAKMRFAKEMVPAIETLIYTKYKPTYPE